MDIWILSQNKAKLLKATGIDIEEKNGKYNIIVYSYSNAFIVAIYKAKQKALKVINDIVKAGYDYQLANPLQYPMIYEMPKEEE